MSWIGKSVWCLTIIVALGGCKKEPPPTALSVCAQLEAAGVATNCRDKAPKGLGADALEAADFDLKSPEGKTGQVLSFRNQEDLDDTVKDFKKMKVLAGRHRYKAKSALIFVQLNEGASTSAGRITEELLGKM